MIQYKQTAYDELSGNITNYTVKKMAASCISQCTGCMCSCRCSCSGGITNEVEWEVI